MKKFLPIFLSLALGLITAAACSSGGGANNGNGNTRASNSSNNSSMMNTMANSVSNAVNSVSNAVTGKPTEEDFWNKAAEGGMAEVALSKVAATKAQNADLKKFAGVMVTDHSKANDELKALAAKMKVTLPSELNSSHKSTLDKLNSLSGADFDKAYTDAMVSDHDATVDLFQAEADSGTTADLKAFAAKTLPTLKNHQSMIRSIKEKMK
jgi:putative membrane protein